MIVLVNMDSAAASVSSCSRLSSPVAFITTVTEVSVVAALVLISHIPLKYKWHKDAQWFSLLCENIHLRLLLLCYLASD